MATRSPGYLNLRTKRAFDRAPGRHITLTTGYSYTEDYQHKSVPFTNPLELYLLDVNYSDVLSVFGRKNNLGVSVTFNYTIPNHIINEIGHRTAAANTDAYYVGVPAAGQPIQPLLRAAGAGQWGNLGRPLRTSTSRRAWTTNWARIRRCISKAPTT